jgi:hypothetical protein
MDKDDDPYAILDDGSNKHPLMGVLWAFVGAIAFLVVLIVVLKLAL